MDGMVFDILLFSIPLACVLHTRNHRVGRLLLMAVNYTMVAHSSRPFLGYRKSGDVRVRADTEFQHSTGKGLFIPLPEAVFMYPTEDRGYTKHFWGNQGTPRVGGLNFLTICAARATIFGAPLRRQCIPGV